VPKVVEEWGGDGGSDRVVLLSLELRLKLGFITALLGDTALVEDDVE
jgi:hypothetical protein